MPRKLLALPGRRLRQFARPPADFVINERGGSKDSPYCLGGVGALSAACELSPSYRNGCHFRNSNIDAAIAEARGIRPVTIRSASYAKEGKIGFSTKQEIVVGAVRNGLFGGPKNRLR